MAETIAPRNSSWVVPGAPGDAVQIVGAARAAPLRICLVAPSSARIGGHAVQASLLQAELVATGVHVRFVATDSPFPGWLRLFERVKYVRTLIRTGLYVLRLAAAMRATEVTHVFAAAYWAFLIVVGPAVLLGALLGRPVVVNYHSGEAEDHLRRHPRMVRALVRRSAGLVAPSRFLVDIFGRHGIACSHIPNAIRTDRFRFVVRDAPCLRFLCTRSLEPYYDLPTAVRAFGIISRAEPEAVFTIVGAGSQLEEVRRLVEEMRLQERVCLVGAVPHEEIAGYYAEHDIYLNTSRVDNQPLSLLEAMSSGLLVVSTRAGGIPDLVRHGETGLLAEPGSAEQLAAAALEVIRDHRRLGWITAEARRLAARHAPERIVRGWLDCYASALPANRAARAADAA